MKRLLSILLLTSCSVTLPPGDPQWTGDVQGVTIYWRYAVPGELPAGQVEHADYLPLGLTCAVRVDPMLSGPSLTRAAAHGAGHCLQARYLLAGFSRPDLPAYFTDPDEGFAETYAEAYLRACGGSLRPLGWSDPVPAHCSAAPDPSTVRWP